MQNQAGVFFLHPIFSVPNFRFTCNFHNFCPATGKGKCWKCVAQNISRGKGTDDFATIQGFCAKSVKAIFKTPAKSSRGLFFTPDFLCAEFSHCFPFCDFCPATGMVKCGKRAFQNICRGSKKRFLRCWNVPHYFIFGRSQNVLFLPRRKTGNRAPCFSPYKGRKQGFFRDKKPQNGKISLFPSLPMTDKALCLSYHILWEK